MKSEVFEYEMGGHSHNVECRITRMVLFHISFADNECSDPGKPAHSSMDFYNFSVGAVVHYKCDSGYAISDGDATIKCVRSDEGPNWVGTVPTCLSKYNLISN